MYLCLSYFLGPRSLSDLCLKVYFSKDYSDVEVIIANAALLRKDIPSRVS